jgi:protein PhnA
MLIMQGTLPQAACHVHARLTGGACKRIAHALMKADAMDVKDSNGTILVDGDNVVLIKDLKVKGAGVTIKRGTVIRGIKLTDDPAEIDCRTDKIRGLVLRTEFVRKA